MLSNRVINLSKMYNRLHTWAEYYTVTYSNSNMANNQFNKWSSRSKSIDMQEFLTKLSTFTMITCATARQHCKICTSWWRVYYTFSLCIEYFNVNKITPHLSLKKFKSLKKSRWNLLNLSVTMLIFRLGYNYNDTTM